MNCQLRKNCWRNKQKASALRVRRTTSTVQSRLRDRLGFRFKRLVPVPPGLSVFYRNEAGDIFHTYSTYARGLDILVGTCNYLDLTPKGRNEDEIMDWVRHHDKHEEAKPHGCCHS